MRAPADFIASVVRPEIRALSAYAVDRADGMIKLDAMENPFPPAEEVRAMIAAAAAAVPINRYPDGGGDAVKAALRKALRIPVALDLILEIGRASCRERVYVLV